MIGQAYGSCLEIMKGFNVKISLFESENLLFESDNLKIQTWTLKVKIYPKGNGGLEKGSSQNCGFFKPVLWPKSSQCSQADKNEYCLSK